MAVKYIYEPSLERMVRAVEKVKERLFKAVRAIAASGVPYAVIGGHAVANWVARVDEGAIRNTNDVDILIRRSNLEDVKNSMIAAGFEYSETLGVHAFVDGSTSKISQGVHLLFAGEKVQPDYIDPSPDVTDSEHAADFQVISLEALVRMKLNSYRRKDQVHILDMIGVGLIDDTWPDRFAPPIADRLRILLADPNG